ncbi:MULTISPECIES: type II toxin-antitoxin system prevent-host-death family antitoxin [Rhizobium/Agrobacterium group]|nr:MULTISPECIES: type II toxin-antitoxin system prevent-host-death family antitoxin [Rhizobium/Agrobacterium group]MCF1446506.1 type II toxin-antitoxin system Phd/YefM family antitoxin [Allorhizobium ampelinum]MUO29879.1 type II toxin-antitoxin system prevent-host-death family antitoxin [Agrobacterium vitis]MUO42243.1 type II toxin-antitoxin system prevent-host-death family antitoxin [Agrobacterium vitis]MUP10842.1 type II toxin-antitoxin system prevent-host-death family antitoxin [Agrobacteriu
MGTSSLTSRELNQDVSRAKRAAETGPVVITDRGRPSHVLMTYEDFERLTGKRRNLVEELSMPGLSSIDFDPPRVLVSGREVDLS